MSAETVSDFVANHNWWVAAVLIVFAGYNVGKDWALTDNARDNAQLSSEAQQ